jgi:hypothetical protein
MRDTIVCDLVTVRASSGRTPVAEAARLRARLLRRELVRIS